MPPECVLRLQAQSRCVRTPLAGSGGDIVWHVWDGRGEDQEPIVLLHGGSGSWTHWLRTIDGLRGAGREVWAVDIPGFGDSAAVPGGQDVDAVIAPLHRSLRQVLGAPTCALVGFSFGAMTAGLLEAAHPGLARVLVLAGAPGMLVGAAHRLPLRGWRHLSDPAAQQRVHRHNLATLMLADTSRIDEDTLRLHACNVQRDRMARRRLSSTDILAQALAKVRAPVQVIYGAQDALYAGHFDALRAAYQASGCDLCGFALIADAGHWVQHEQPQAFLAALQAALS